MNKKEPAQKKSLPRRLLRFATKLGLVALGLLLLLEIVLRIAGHHYQQQQLEAMAQRREATDKPVTILAMGESTTGGLWLDFKDSYPKQLERALRGYYGQKNIEVLVPPHSGQNTSQMVHRFEGYLRDFQPALVIFMAGVNNSWSLAESNLGDFLPEGRLRTYLFRIRRVTDDIKVVRLFRLLTSSAGQTRRRIEQDMEGAPLMTDWPPKNDPFVRGVGEEPFWKLWRSDVGQMIEQAQAAGVDVILMTYPNYDTPPVSEFVAMAEKYSVPLIENHKSFAPLIEQGRASEVFFEDLRHPNAPGYFIVVENIMQSIVDHHLLTKVLTPPIPPEGAGVAPEGQPESPSADP